MGQIRIRGPTRLTDVNTAIILLLPLGAKVARPGSLSPSVHVDASTINHFCAPHHLTKAIRASIWALGPLVARFGQGEVALPGGCAINKRSVDMHLAGLEQLGARVDVGKGYVRASAANVGRLRGARILTDKVSVGDTITIMTAATIAVGTTVIENAAREPEMVDTANFLKALGAMISGARGAKITITGVESLGDTNGTCIYRVIPDRIEAGTFLVAAAVTGGKVLCRNSTHPDTLSIPLKKLREAGADIQRPSAVSFWTAPYPGLPTDLQPLFTLLNLVADEGYSGTVTETVFEVRFRPISELVQKVICHGTNKPLSGANVTATDLRAAATLVLAVCCADGTTVVGGISLLERGYERFEEKLKELGARINRTSNLCRQSHC
ncbi:UDP-N-acetylglucosamine 1-carboxyvinyltransferase [Aspergillus filifer]